MNSPLTKVEAKNADSRNLGSKCLPSPYSELYTDVAVMFASIPNYMDFYTEAELHEGGVTCLMILNEIVSAFDEVDQRSVS